MIWVNKNIIDLEFQLIEVSKAYQIWFFKTRDLLFLKVHIISSTILITKIMGKKLHYFNFAPSSFSTEVKLTFMEVHIWFSNNVKQFENEWITNNFWKVDFMRFEHMHLQGNYAWKCFVLAQLTPVLAWPQ